MLFEDVFVFLAECSVYIVPYAPLDLQHVMRLCYSAEMVKVTAAFLSDPGSAMTYAHGHQDDQTRERWQRKSTKRSASFSAFVQCILDHLISSNGAADAPSDLGLLANPNQRFQFDQFLRVALSSYALTFLRKCILLLHVRGSVDFVAPSGPSAEPELARLSRLLGLPGLDELVESFTTPNPISARINKLTSHWISHWAHHGNQGHGPLYLDHSTHHSQPPAAPSTLAHHSGNRPDSTDTLINALGPGHLADLDHDDMRLVYGRRGDDAAPRPSPNNSTALRLPHPGIYELVALPQTHDMLNAIAMSRRCPTSGRELSDPNLCLLCGEMLCGQALCCMADGRGGCFRHQARCGGNVGLFLNVRRCAVLLLNGRNGSFFAAPYLDRHGETDWGLKRHHQLWLNMKRYDRLYRDLWLAHGVPSAVSRKLEGDSNNTGGWETQ